MFPSSYIPQELYKKKAIECVHHVNGIPFMNHPLIDGIYIETSEISGFEQHSPDSYIRQQFLRLEKAYAKKDTYSYVFSHVRRFRLQALLDAQIWSQPEKWYETAGSVWTDSEGPGINSRVWRLAVFNTLSAHLTMNKGELERYTSFVPTIVYRGADSERHVKNGLSWTLNREKAIWFAKRFQPEKSYLASVQVKRIHVAAIFLRRGEEEVVLRKIPRALQVTEL